MHNLFKILGRQPGIVLILIVMAIATLTLPLTGSDTVPKKNTQSEFLQAQALRLLDEAKLEAGTLEPASAAGLFLVVGQAYTRVNNKKAKEALEISYQNMRAAMEQAPDLVGFMAPDLISATVEAAPDTIEQNLPPEKFRDSALAALVLHHLRHDKELNRALDLFFMMQGDEAMTVPARELLMRIPAAQQYQRDRVFGAVLQAYSQKHHRQVGTGSPEDLGTLVVRFWRDLSPSPVRDAIDELLKQAKTGDAVVMNSPQGTTTLTAYQFRLFQVFPALKAIDPIHAEALLREESQTADLLARYPQGQQSVDPWLRDTPMKDGEKQETTYAYVGNPSTVPSLANRMEYNRTMEAFSAAAEQDAATAIANASRIPDPATRLRVLVGIARKCQTGNPAAAKNALHDALKSLPDNEDTGSLKDAANIAIRLGDLNTARAAVMAGLKAARRIYNDDSDPDAPNMALKPYWPSVQAYRDIVGVQAKISPDDALETIKHLPDAEVAALEKVMLAAEWLNARLFNTSPMVAKRPKESSTLTDDDARVEFVSLGH